MSDSHSLARKYMRRPASMNSTGTGYPLPVFLDDGTTWLAGGHVLFISADGPELPEIDIPMEYLKARGAEVTLAGQDWIFHYRQPAGYIVVAEWLSDRISIKADASLKEITDLGRYDAIFIPGGAWNPDMLRIDKDALRIVREARARGLLITSLCHGPQVLISASAEDALFPPGTRITGVENIRIDLFNAGFTVVDAGEPEDKADVDPVFDEQSQLLTARNPYDIGSLCRKMGELLRCRIERRTQPTTD